MKNTSLFTLLATCLCFTHTAYADNHRPDAHAPIGVARDHIHKSGEVMFSYRYAMMHMQGARDGSQRVSTDKVLNNYMVAPLQMDMKMHMAGAMYGITDNLTIAAMGSLIEKDMRMLNRGNKVIDREATGFGDTKVNAMYGLVNNENNKVQFNLGLSIPTGSIKENYQGTVLSYPMQLGSGSYEALPGVSYTGLQDGYSYGAQVNGIFRLDTNNTGYKLGDSYNVTAWTAKKLNNAFSLSSRLNYTITNNIKGADDSLMLMMIPVNNTSVYAGRSLDFLLGTNFIVPQGPLKGHRLALEAGMPLYQSFNGIRLEKDYSLTLGWQKAF